MNPLLPLWNWLGPDLLAEILISAAAAALGAAASLRANKKKALLHNFRRKWICEFATISHVPVPRRGETC